ncbi:MAG: GNAT family N-acetyltransferase [Anaerolineae bacterium]|nr:GNAT family N-acetyltransferase [Anaerolineae bacterium]
MTLIAARTATLDDTAAITTIHTSAIERWQRIDTAGRVMDVPYAALTLYERWLHGGPWMNIETCAVHLTHLLRGAGIPLVAELDGRVLAHAEVYHGVEPQPFGEHLHVAVATVHAEYAGQGLEQALLAHAIELARELGCARVCLEDAGAEQLYDGEGWQRLVGGQRLNWPARPGQVFYQAMPHTADNPELIRGWAMPLGRYHSARQEWVTRWPDLWGAVPGLRDQRIRRLQFTMAATTFFVLYIESPYDPRRASVFVWTPKPLSGPMLTAINDRAHKLGYRRLDAFVADAQVGALGADAETDGYTQDLYSIELA